MRCRHHAGAKRPRRAVHGQPLARKAVFCVVGLLSILFLGRCRQTPQRTGAEILQFEELVAHPQTYHGSEICTAGIYASGFESAALGASTYEVDGAVYLTRPAIWIEGAQIRGRGECFEAGGMPEAEFCQVEVCGVFESGGGFGHLGGYDYRLRAPSEEAHAMHARRPRLRC